MENSKHYPTHPGAEHPPVMTCDKLEKFDSTSNADRSAGIESRYAYDADEVDEAIAELKDENQRLKKKMDDYHLMSDIRRAKIKELKRELWMARSLALSRFDVDKYLRKYKHCNSRFWNDGFNTFDEACKQMQKAINIAEAKCIAKAKEYK